MASLLNPSCVASLLPGHVGWTVADGVVAAEAATVATGVMSSPGFRAKGESIGRGGELLLRGSRTAHSTDTRTSANSARHPIVYSGLASRWHGSRGGCVGGHLHSRR